MCGFKYLRNGFSLTSPCILSEIPVEMNVVLTGSYYQTVVLLQWGIPVAALCSGIVFLELFKCVAVGNILKFFVCFVT